MHSKLSECTYRRSYNDRSSRQWDDYDWREDRHETPRDSPRDSFQNYRGDSHNNTERISRAREYSNSPQSHYSQDSLTRDWSRKSPLRRRSPALEISERKRRKFVDDQDNIYRYRHESLEKSYSVPANNYSHDYSTKEIKYDSTHEDDFKYKKSPPDSRYRRHTDEFPLKKHEDSSGRTFHDSYREEDGYKKRWESSRERPRSPYRSPQIYEKARDRPSDSTSLIYQQDYQQHGRKFSVNGSSGQSFDSDTSRQTAAVPEKKSSTGFQRFLDVLNKGVNIDVLTKIVTQTPSHHLGPDASECSWTPSCNEWQQNRQPHEKSHNLVSSQPQRQSKILNKQTVSNQQRTDELVGLFSKKSPLPPEKITLSPEDQQKQRQMQNVLQAIGVDLGFEEVGKMSHRIRERLYGKDVDNDLKANKESATKQTVSSRHERRSSSSSSSSSRCRVSPGTRDYYVKNDICHDQRELHQNQNTDFRQMGYSSFQDANECLPQKISAAVEVFSTDSTYRVSQLPPTPTIPMYSTMNCSPQMYPPPSQAPPHVLPGIGQGLCLPVYTPCPPVQPPNMFPMLSQMGHLVPTPTSYPQPQLFSPPNVNTLPGLNKTQKFKPQARPRCLQVIK